MLPLAEWQNLLEVQASAAATLTGLVFVAASINLSRIIAVPSLPPRGRNHPPVSSGLLPQFRGTAWGAWAATGVGMKRSRSVHPANTARHAPTECAGFSANDLGKRIVSPRNVPQIRGTANAHHPTGEIGWRLQPIPQKPPKKALTASSPPPTTGLYQHVPAASICSRFFSSLRFFDQRL
jgi:hypothetical protein